MRDQGRAVRTRVGRMVQQLRLQRGWSQEKLAERAHSSPKHVGRIEQGKVDVGVVGLARLARALSVKISDLLAEPAGRQAPRAAVVAMTPDDLAHFEGVSAFLRRIKSSRARPSRGPAR